ncbi:ABC transporter permease subunit [Mesorhizobium sp. M0778]|uniref:ABC transporter permease n=1 Tax=Mesorhizobium sp. M0778 TaxID=2956999 RepID=UPI0033356E62
MISKRQADTILVWAVRGLIAVTVVFLLLPVLVTALIAFDSRDYIGTFPPPAMSLRWFINLWNHSYIWGGFKTSLLLATSATIVASVTGALAALAINRMSPRWRDLVTTIFLSPLVLPGVIIGFALLMFFSLLAPLPAFVKLLASHLIITMPYTVRMTLIGLTGIGASLREAALSLGATESQAFFTITLPLAKNGIAAGAIFAFAFSMDDVAISLFLSDFNTYTLPVALISLMKSKFDLTIAAAAVGLMAVTVILLIVLDRVIGLERAIGQGIYRMSK